MPERAFELTSKRIADHVIAIGAQDNEWYRSSEQRMCPAGILCLQPVRFPDWRGYPSRLAFNSSSEWKFYRPMIPGQTVVLRWRVIDRWLKRKKEYLTFEMPVTDQTGQPLALCRFSEAVLNPPPYDPPLPVRDHEASTLLIETTGPEWGVLKRTFTVEMAKSFADHEISWHTDLEEARKMGYSYVVLLGAHFVAQLIELMTRIFGLGFLQGGRLHVNTLRPVAAGETIVARAVEHSRSPDPDGTQRVQLAVWCEDSAGRKTTSGIASARIVGVGARKVIEGT